MRFDLALFQLRLFKSRSQAGEAIRDGSALLNGARVKAGHAVRPGDRITIAGTHGRRTLEVLALPERPPSRDEAKSLVREVVEP